MSQNKKAGTSRESYFSRYKTNNVYKTNRLRKLNKLLKEQPNNEQIKLAINSVTANPRRGTPKNHYWSKSMRATAVIMKTFTGKFDKLFFSSKDDDVFAATKARNTELFQNLPKFTGRKYSEFSLGARAKDSNGKYIWNI